MPSIERARTAFAVSDVELSDWAQGQGLSATPTQVSFWRRRGLIPAPTVICARPVGAPPGRAARRYTRDELAVARQAVRFLVRAGRRGRSHADLALLMFAAGLTVDHTAVVAALKRQLMNVQREIDSLVARADAETVDAGQVMTLSPAYERAERLALYAIRSRAKMVGHVRRQLRLAGKPAKDSDLLTPLVAMLQTMLGEPPSPDDTFALESMLHVHGAHGLVEPAVPGGSPVVPDGPGALGESLALAVHLGLFDVPDDIAPTELQEAREFAQSLSSAMRAIPDDRLRYFIGGEHVVGFWQPTDPFDIAQVIVHIVKLRRHVTIDVSPIIDAVRQQGWLDGQRARPRLLRGVGDAETTASIESGRRRPRISQDGYARSNRGRPTSAADRSGV